MKNLFPRRGGKSGGPADPEAQRAMDALRRIRRAGDAASAGHEVRALRRRRRRRNAVRFLALSACAVGGVGIAAGVVFGGSAGFQWVRENTGVFHVQDIVVSGMDKLSRDRILEAGGLDLDDDILAVDTDSVAARVATLPEIRRVSARRTWKREVILSVVERKPCAAVLLDRLCEVDEEGVVLPADPSGSVSDLLIVRGLDCSPAPPGQKLVSPGLAPALSLVSTLSRPELGLESMVSEIWAGEADSLVMILLSNAVPVRVGRGDIPPRRLMAFRAVIEDLAAKKIDPEYLDLRFSGQIVVKPRPEAPEEDTGRDGAENRGSTAVHRGRRSRHGLNT